MRRTLAFVVLVGWLVVPAAGQDKPYELKIKKEAKGDRLKVTSTDASDLNFLIAVMGQELKKGDKKVEKLAYTEEVLDRAEDAKKATKLTRAYTTAEESDGDSKKTYAYHGKTVLIEKKGDKYHFSVDGKELDEEDTKALDEEFNKKDEFPLENADLMPDKPVKVNETWTVDPKKVARAFESGGPLTVDAEKTKVTGKLVKVYLKGGKQFGVMELSMTLAVTELKLDGDDFPMKAGSTVTVAMTLDACIDGSSHTSVENSSLMFDLNGELPNGMIVIKGKAKLDFSTEDLGRK